MIKKEKSFLYGIFIVVFCAIGLICSINSYAVPPKLNPVPSDYHTGLSWEEAQKLDKPIVINFYVDWCGACRKFAPVLEEVRKEIKNEFSFVVINSDLPENEKLVKDFQITGFPSLFYISKKTGERVKIDFYYYFDKDKLKQELKNLSKTKE